MPYSLDDFDKTFEKGFTYQLPLDVRQIIEALSNEVGAPGYVCTPSFEKRHIEFKAPVVKPVNTMDEIRKHMNKISDRTFDTLKEKIVSEIQNTDDKNAVKNVLFTIASGNAFYSKLYAKLYKVMCDTFEEFEPPLNSNFVFSKPFEHCNPNEDYDLYCEITKTNEQRRALALFCVNLFIEGATSSDIVFTLLDNIEERFQNSIIHSETKPVTDELSEILYIVLINSKEHLDKDDKWNACMQRVTKFSQMKQSPHNGVTSKSIFKHLDLLDAIGV